MNGNPDVPGELLTDSELTQIKELVTIRKHLTERDLEILLDWIEGEVNLSPNLVIRNLALGRPVL